MQNLRLVTNPVIPDGPQITAPEVQAMQRAVINLFNRWGLTDEEAVTLLGGIVTRTYGRWKAGDLGRVTVDQSARLSNLMGIHKALRLMFKEPARGYGWIKRPNAVFGGAAALDIMLGGQLTDLMRVRRYLDAARGHW